MDPTRDDRRPLPFPQTLRLKAPAQFQAVYDRKKSVSDERLIVYAGENGLPHARLGVSVSRKVGGAVLRNWYKRLFREAFRLSQHDLPAGVDLIMIPRPGPEPTVVQLQASLVKLAAQAAKRLAAPPRGPAPSPAPPPAPAEARP
ncbi:ribonuclease P protein component [Fimbriiglobus ruber]|uniref:Ribonuclease P protein component n=1 Tax=Fimbriiglobus ruber TaxID=1908690 RepID=A0A225E952_9BACT|nr:ribonuclease P protein component [Fimbriiglobus ruber]OWK45125.1 Ribonuclease P protein component [Fimbriiglobus ruber]